MFKFLKRISLFFIGLFIVYLLSFFIIDYLYNNKNTENAIFIWGDSQTYQGIDLVELQKLTSKNIYTAARHGAGVYDFYVFAEKIPIKSTVIVSLSIPAQMRKKYYDRNAAGLSFKGLISLYKNKYSLSEILRILKNNLKAKELFLTKTKMYPMADTITHNEPISIFKDIFSSKPNYLQYKQNIYFEAFNMLKNKKCNIIVLRFPLHHEIDSIYNNSPANETINNFEKQIVNLLNVKEKTIPIKSDKNLMYDLSHYNSLGAKLATIKIAEKYNNRKNNQFIIFEL